MHFIGDLLLFLSGFGCGFGAMGLLVMFYNADEFERGNKF